MSKGGRSEQGSAAPARSAPLSGDLGQRRSPRRLAAHGGTGIVKRVRPTYVKDSLALGVRLRDARRRARLTQSDLAFAGCSAGYISRIEAGDRVPSLQILRRLAERLGVSEDFLVSGHEPDRSASSALADAEILLRMGEIVDAAAGYEKALRDATGDEERAAALEGLGHVAVQQAQPREAISYFERSLRLSGGEPSDRPRLAESLGRACATVGDVPRAIALFRTCVERFNRESDVVQYIRFACLLSYALTDTGEFGEAERIVARAIQLGQEVADPYTRSRLYWSQSRVMLEQGKSDVAERYARKALEILRTTEDTYALGHAYQSLANVYLDLGRADDAAQTLRDGWHVIEPAATPLELAHYQIDEARALLACGEKARAAELAYSVIERLGDAMPGDRGRTYLLLAEIIEELGDTGKALELSEFAVKLLEPLGPNRYLISGYRRLAALLKAEGRADDALSILERAVRTQDAVGRALA